MAGVTVDRGSLGDVDHAAQTDAPGQGPVGLGLAQHRAVQIRAVTGLTGVAISPQEDAVLGHPARVIDIVEAMGSTQTLAEVLEMAGAALGDFPGVALESGWR